ncbi:MAG: hypothetical protein ACRC0X_02085 [Brevinema sp.]
MPQGISELNINLLKKRITNGERPIVESEFLQLRNAILVRSTQTQDIKVEQNPQEIYLMMTEYAIALGVEVPSMFGISR